MRPPYRGCDRDCFNCQYPDCYQPDYLCCLPDDSWMRVWEHVKARQARNQEKQRALTRTRINKRRIQNG